MKNAFPLISAQHHPKRTVQVGPLAIGNGAPVIIAGPCTVESHQQLMTIARSVRDSGAHMLRGGSFKPRTSPYAFQGLGEEALSLLAEVGREVSLPVVSEMLDPDHAPLFERYADMIQIGARNMQNFALLKKVAKIGKPVLLKRGFGNTVQEWLLAAEYLASEGLQDIVLCERGSRGFDPGSRFVFDLSAALRAQKLSCLPVITDPSHASGHDWMVSPLALASLAAGLDGFMTEVHHQPEEALCDGEQALSLTGFAALATKAKVFC